MQPRLRLVPVRDVSDPIEDQLAAVLAYTYRRRGFTEMQRMLTRQVEAVAKANRLASASEGWIA